LSFYANKAFHCNRKPSAKLVIFADLSTSSMQIRRDHLHTYHISWQASAQDFISFVVLKQTGVWYFSCPNRKK